MTIRKITAVTMLAASAQFAQAAWDIKPELLLEAGVEDNIRLSPDNEDDATVTTAEVRARFRNVTERSFVDARLGARFTSYSDTNLDNNESARLRIDSERKGERWGVGALVDARRDTLLRYGQVGGTTGGAVDDQAPEVDDAIDPIDPDQGNIEADVTRTRMRVRPNLSYRISERSKIQVEGIYNKATFSNTGGLTIRDSDEIGAGVRYTHRLSERDTLQLQAQQTTFEPDGLPEAEQSRASVAWNRRVTERTSFKLEAGARRTDPDNGSAETGLLLRGSARHRTQLGQFFILAERSNTPTAFGEIYQYDRAFLEWSRSLSERWSLDARLQFTSTESETDNGVSRADADYGEAFVTLSHSLSETWRVGAQYRYRQVERELQNGTGRSNGFYLRLEYTPLMRI